MIKIDTTKASSFVDAALITRREKELVNLHSLLVNKTGKGNDFLGWVDLPASLDPAIVGRIKADAERIGKKSQLLVVIGIGGSYLGSRAVIDALAQPFSSLLKEKKFPFVVYAGENLSEDYHSGLLDLLDQYDYSVAVISKSGTTTEPAVAFRLIKSHMEKKYGKKEAADRIIAVTDAQRGALKNLAGKEGYSTYVIPDDVGGRYSVLTPVGLLPIAVAGFDIEKLLQGARDMRETCLASTDPEKNPAIKYAAIRNALYQNGKSVEIMVNYQPNLFYLAEWWKQLYGESEGKENKGIFPAGVGFTTDLHSMGQYIQEGVRMLFETTISVKNPGRELKVPFLQGDPDGLNFLEGRRLDEINHMAELGTLLAHVDGGVPNIRIEIEKLDEYTLGQLIYFFEFACALSGYLLGVNPFDQPGVEAYKKNMFALIGKPGFEEEGKRLREKLN
ncbi:MAG: glucose-6-phosphate isomerase [Bacteroidetes bacterium]|nr:glucose-6-phosphate isomerase [Bacteroidota bacterium]